MNIIDVEFKIIQITTTHIRGEENAELYGLDAQGNLYCLEGTRLIGSGYEKAHWRLLVKNSSPRENFQ